MSRRAARRRPRRTAFLPSFCNWLRTRTSLIECLLNQHSLAAAAAAAKHLNRGFSRLLSSRFSRDTSHHVRACLQCRRRRRLALPPPPVKTSSDGPKAEILWYYFVDGKKFMPEGSERGRAGSLDGQALNLAVIAIPFHLPRPEQKIALCSLLL